MKNISKHILLIGSLIFPTAIGINAQKTTFTCDFENGIPETFATYDLDNLTPSRTMKKYGFEQGIAWVAYTEGANTVAYSGSWYSESGIAANDWLVTPAIKIEDAHDILSWKAQATDKTHADGYAVYITTKGNKPEDFTDEPVFKIEAESDKWTEHFISLQQWAGEDIYIAFVNNSTDCNMLAIDNINVFSYENSFGFTNLTPEAVNQPGEVYIKGEIYSSGFLPVEGYAVELSFGDTNYTIDNSSVIIEPNEKSTFEFEVPIITEKDNTVDYILTISSMNGTDVMTYNGSITCFKRTVFIEEGTGTWCQYCPCGQYALEQLHLQYPGEFVDVAVHFSDQMSITEYQQGMDSFFSGLPSCVLDRNYDIIGDPYYDISELWNKASAIGSIARLSCNAYIDDSNKINISTTSEFGKEITSGAYSLAFIIVEDDMTGFPQQNAFAGSDMDLGGIEDMDDIIPAGEYFFANVARAIYPSFNGDDEAFPVGTPRHTPIETSHQFDMINKVQNAENLKVVAIILNNENGQVINACETKLIDNSSVEDIADCSNFNITNQALSVAISAEEEINNVEIWSADGKLLKQVTPNATYTLIDKNATNGIVIIKVYSATETAIFKQIW